MADDYRVGYGRPPLHTRFQRGKSGNPAGRPSGSKGLREDLKEELQERVNVTLGKRAKRIPKRRLILKALSGKAMKGDVRAAEKLLNLDIQAHGFDGQGHGLNIREGQLPEHNEQQLNAWLRDKLAALEASEMADCPEPDAPDSSEDPSEGSSK